jgi:hypothetical protein
MRSRVEHVVSSCVHINLSEILYMYMYILDTVPVQSGDTHTYVGTDTDTYYTQDQFHCMPNRTELNRYATSPSPTPANPSMRSQDPIDWRLCHVLNPRHCLAETGFVGCWVLGVPETDTSWLYELLHGTERHG